MQKKKEKKHAKKESKGGVHVGNANYDRVRFCDKDCNDYKPEK
jgi:hypothetical protein